MLLKNTWLLTFKYEQNVENLKKSAQQILSQPNKSPEFVIFKILMACEKGIQYFTCTENAMHHWTQTRHVLKVIKFSPKVFFSGC